MRRHMLMVAMLVAASSAVMAARPHMYLKVTSGKALVWNKDVGGWTSVADTQGLAYTDSVFLDNNEEATLHLGEGAKVLLRGLCRGGLEGQDLDAKGVLVEGQMFLQRKKPYQFNTINAVLRECVFTPLGTAGAIRMSSRGEPTVAMLEGKMRVQASGGEAALVGPGEYAVYGAGKTFSQGKLARKDIDALEQWSGMSYAGPPPEAAPAEPRKQTAASTQAAAPGSAAVTNTPSNDPLPPTQTSDDEPNEAPGGDAASGSTQPEAAAKSAEPQEGDPEATSSAEPEGEDGGDAVEAGRAPDKPTFEVGAAVATVGDEQWTLLSLGVDVPIWRFGIFFDLEFWINDEGQFSDKGWTFDPWYESLFRKIRYLRFNHEGDPFYFKLGGLGSVTMGYGFVVNRFTNMLDYPDKKLLGLQLQLNDLGPIGLTYEGLVADFYDFAKVGDTDNRGGVMAHRLGFKPLKATETPLIKDLLLAGTYAVDLNQWAGTRDWHYEGMLHDKDANGFTDWDYAYELAVTAAESSYVDGGIAMGIVDDPDSIPQYETPDTVYQDSVERFSIWGVDAGMPLVDNKMVRLDLYGQFASRMDDISGWGIGAPGLLLTFLPEKEIGWIGVEYRYIKGQFEPGYFNTYYLNERVTRYPEPSVKSRSLPEVSVNGVFGQAGVNIANAVLITGSYQYLVGDQDKDQRYEAAGSIGSLIMEKIPKFTRAELYLHKSQVGESVVVDRVNASGEPVMRADGVFEKTPYMYWGYRLGFEITKGAELVWETRHGWKYNSVYELVEDNSFLISTAFRF